MMSKIVSNEIIWFHNGVLGPELDSSDAILKTSQGRQHQVHGRFVMDYLRYCAALALGQEVYDATKNDTITVLREKKIDDLLEHREKARESWETFIRSPRINTRRQIWAVLKTRGYLVRDMFALNTLPLRAHQRANVATESYRRDRAVILRRVQAEYSHELRKMFYDLIEQQRTALFFLVRTPGGFKEHLAILAIAFHAIRNWGGEVSMLGFDKVMSAGAELLLTLPRKNRFLISEADLLVHLPSFDSFMPDENPLVTDAELERRYTYEWYTLKLRLFRAVASEHHAELRAWFQELEEQEIVPIRTVHSDDTVTYTPQNDRSLKFAPDDWQEFDLATTVPLLGDSKDSKNTAVAWVQEQETNLSLQKSYSRFIAHTLKRNLRLEHI